MHDAGAVSTDLTAPRPTPPRDRVRKRIFAEPVASHTAPVPWEVPWRPARAAIELRGAGYSVVSVKSLKRQQWPGVDNSTRDITFISRRVACNTLHVIRVWGNTALRRICLFQCRRIQLNLT